jgi:hypothetical protein
LAKNTSKRIPVKWIRDKAKSAYEKQEHCWICNTEKDLELHHLGSITLLLENWVVKTGVDISTDEAVVAMRDEFIEAHYKEIYKDVYTLCNRHHVALHSVFGKAPALNTVDRQRSWIEIQKTKALNKEDSVKKVFVVGNFSPFVLDTSFKRFWE